MNHLDAALRTVLRELGRRRTRIALVGGLAVSARTEPRFTRDLDLAIAIGNDAEAETLVHALIRRGYVAISVVEHEVVQRLATVRLQLPAGRSSVVVADLLFASSGIEREVVVQAEALEWLPRLIVPVARVGHLIALKLHSRDDRSRPQDVADLHALFRVATKHELARAARAVRLIEQRGFARGRDLQAALVAWRREHGR